MYLFFLSVILYLNRKGEGVSVKKKTRGVGGGDTKSSRSPNVLKLFIGNIFLFDHTEVTHKRPPKIETMNAKQYTDFVDARQERGLYPHRRVEDNG